MENGGWKTYKNIRPVWEDDFLTFSKTKRLLAHARSAYNNEGIAVENNMPFEDGKRVFIFNGELHGVRIHEQGRIGAEKIFNFIRRFDRGDLLSALKKAVEILQERSRYIRAMNLILDDGKTACVASLFNEDPAYFTMHVRRNRGECVVCSEPYPDGSGWVAIPNHAVEVVSC